MFVSSYCGLCSRCNMKIDVFAWNLFGIYFEICFPCSVGDLQDVEPTLIKRVSLRFSKRSLLRKFLDEAMSYAHLFHRFKYPADTAEWGFFIIRIIAFILFLYPGRFGKRSVSHGKGWHARLRRVDWNSSAKLLIAVGMMLNKIMKFGKKNCVYMLNRWNTEKMLSGNVCRSLTGFI